MNLLIALRNALIILALSWVGVTVESRDARHGDCSDSTVCIAGGHAAN